MLKLKILSVGKTKETWLEEAIEEYRKRLNPTLELSFAWFKDDAQLQEAAAREGRLICLDPKGKSLTSEDFSKFLINEFTLGGSRLSFVIGGPEGLPPALRNNHPLLSLSPLTLTHQMTRLLLVEQVYRAFEIARGSPYHK